MIDSMSPREPDADCDERYDAEDLLSLANTMGEGDEGILAQLSMIRSAQERSVHDRREFAKKQQANELRLEAVGSQIGADVEGIGARLERLESLSKVSANERASMNMRISGLSAQLEAIEMRVGTISKTLESTTALSKEQLSQLRSSVANAEMQIDQSRNALFNTVAPAARETMDMALKLQDGHMRISHVLTHHTSALQCLRSVLEFTRACWEGVSSMHEHLSTSASRDAAPPTLPLMPALLEFPEMTFPAFAPKRPRFELPDALKGP